MNTETENKTNFFEIFGYWKDNPNERIDGYIVTESECEEEETEGDDSIFFYGLNESLLIEAVELGENTSHEFVIESFEKI
jgi:hypothetical protein